jgi:hypothetical protein
MTKPKPKDQLQKRGRKSDFRPEYILIAKACARFGAIEDEIANELNIGPATLDRWKQKYPEFRCALKAGKDAFDDRVERSLYQRAVGWGNLPPDVTACIFWLKNRRKGAPEFYFDDAQAAYEQMSTEITRGKIKTDRPDWRGRADENWLKNCSVHIAYVDLQSVFPQNGPKLLTSNLIGPAVRPSEVSYLSPTEAVYWIATRGDTVRCAISEVEGTWKPVVAELLKKIAEGDLDLFGRRHDAGLHEKIPREVLADIRIDYPFQVWSEHVLSDEPYLELSGIGSNDNLFSERKLQWSNLRLNGAEIDRLWPFRERSKSGRKECYDGERLRKDVEARLISVGSFASKADFKRWCLEPGRVKLKAGARLPRNKKRGDPPDAHTLDGLLRRHEIFNIPSLIDKTS